MPGGLQQLFIDGKEHLPKGVDAADGQIAARQLQHQRVTGLGEQIGTHPKEAEEQEEHIDAYPQEQAVSSHFASLLPVALPHTPGQQGVDPHASAHTQGDDEHLDGKGQSQGVHGIVPHTRHLCRVLHGADEVAVHDVVASLDDQGTDEGMPRERRSFGMGVTAIGLALSGLDVGFLILKPPE